MKILSWLVFLCAIIIMFGGSGASIYLDIRYMFIGGVVCIIDAAKATPVEAMGIAVGILRVLLSGLVAVIGIAVSIIIGAGLIQVSTALERNSRIATKRTFSK